MIKKKFIPVCFLVTLATAVVSAQNVPQARQALFDGRIDEAAAALEGESASAEVQILRSMVDVGQWFENDLPEWLTSISASRELSAIKPYFDLARYVDEGQWWQQDPVNAFFEFELSERMGQAWRRDGTLSASATRPAVQVDFWLAVSDQDIRWDEGADAYVEEPLLFTLQFDGASARMVELEVLFEDPEDPTYFEGEIFVNGLPIGEFYDWGFERGYRIEHAGIEEYWHQGNDFTMRVYLAPGDKLTLEVDPDWWHHGSGNEIMPAFGIRLANASDFSVRNGVGYDVPQPKFAGGTFSDVLPQFLLSETAPTTALLSSIIQRLEAVQPGFNVTFSPAETGFAETVRVQYEDVQIMLAGLKFAKGLQLVLDLYEVGSVEFSGTSYADYLEDPTALWDDHPELLQLVASRSPQGAQARSFFQAAVAHYEAVESELWTRMSGINDRFLFEVEGDAAQRLALTNRLSAIEDSLTDLVPLESLDPDSSGGERVTLAPFFRQTPVALRPLVPAFDERDFLVGNATPLAAAGFTSGISAFKIDKYLAEIGWLYIPPPEALTGKILYLNSTVSPYWGTIDAAYLFNTNGSTSVADPGTASTVRAYTWDAGQGILRDLSAGKGFELVFETAASGYFETLPEENDGSANYPERGRFILYDADRDLDGDAQADSIQVAENQRPLYQIDPLEEENIFAIFENDWDGDGILDDDEAPSEFRWYAGSSDLGGGWRWFDWLESFNVSQDPWIFHNEHGWLFRIGDDPAAGMYFFDLGQGSFFYTTSDIYPTMYRFSDNKWVFYDRGSSNPRWFVDLVTGEWERVE